MGLPEPTPLDPGPPESTSPDSVPSANDGRADWLCGPDEGLEAELTRTQEGASLQAPRLSRPGADAPPPPPPRIRLGGGMPGPTSFVPSAPPTSLPGAAPGNVPQAWTGAASSVPRLNDVNEPVARPQGIDTSRVEFPMEEFTDRAAPPPSEPEPGERLKKAAIAPSEFVAPVYRPWWQEALEEFKKHRLWQLLAAGLLLIPIALMLMPRGPRAVAIRDVKANARAWDGQTMRISGKVGEVFATGAGYTFYLLQGRDTMVVFTRSRVPTSQQKLSVTGTLSTGFLDGQARLALFEEAQ